MVPNGLGNFRSEGTSGLTRDRNWALSSENSGPAPDISLDNASWNLLRLVLSRPLTRSTHASSSVVSASLQYKKRVSEIWLGQVNTEKLL